jgi:hypothetical protein
MRFAVLFGGMGVAAALAGEVMSHVVFALDFSGDVHANVQTALLGAIFGAVTLVPVSRWLGRGWVAACLAVPVAAVGMLAALHVTWAIEEHLEHSVWDLRWEVAICLIADGTLLALWMTDLRRPMLAPVAAVVVAGLISAQTSHVLDLAIIRYYGAPFAPSLVWELSQFSEHLTQTILLSLAVPLRLLWAADCCCGGSPAEDLRFDESAAHPRPRPAANTAATDTENPPSNTDVAVSPDSNSP